MISKYSPKSEFGKNIVTLSSGTAISQLIPLIVTPILSRIYDVEAFGVFAVYMSVALLIGVISTFRYELAILLPEKKSDAIDVVLLAIVLIFISFLLSLFIIPIFFNQISLLTGNHPVMQWIVLLPISILVMGFNQTFGYWLNREKNYRGLSAAKIWQNASTAGIKLLIGLYSTTALGLIWGNIIGYGVAASIFAFIFFKHNKGSLKNRNKSDILLQAKRYNKFPKYDMPSSLLNTLSSQIPILMLAYFFNATVVGWYSVAHTVLKMPMSFLGVSIGQVFFQHSSSLRNDPEAFRNTTFSLFKRLMCLGVIPMAFLASFGDLIFGFVLGAEWATAGIYAQILAPWLLFVFITSPISNVLNVLEKQQVNLRFNVIIVVLRIVALVIGGVYFVEEFMSIILFGLVSFVMWLLFSLEILKLSGVSRRKTLRFSLPIMFAAGLFMFALRFAWNELL